MTLALDATYSLGKNLSGVGIYSREILFGLAAAHPNERFKFYYRPHRFLKSFQDHLPKNASRRLLTGAPSADVFHALNQRVDAKARRTVSTFHDLFVMTGDYSSPEFRARFTAQARAAADRSDLIIAVSNFTASQIEQLLKVETSRIRVVHHGVAPHGQRTAMRKHADTPLVLSVGAIQRRKNIASLVTAFEKLPAHWRLALAGAPDGYGAAEELRAVEKSKARARIDVLGYVSKAQLEALYSQASIFAFPSLDEGFGMPILEAMAHGVPVLTSNRSAMPEVAGDAALLVDPNNIDDALLRLATDQPLRENLIRLGLERIKQFTWDAAIAKTWAVYDELR
ncbi:MAG TPA: glycosyltransferase family 1 protein [Bryobacteraceae bacterium]|nr:glycosyltransferase family 1 protein [Bryobacteraceae bacterium]